LKEESKDEREENAITIVIQILSDDKQYHVIATKPLMTRIMLNGAVVSILKLCTGLITFIDERLSLKISL
jgi:hypothetical protein